MHEYHHYRRIFLAGVSDPELWAKVCGGHTVNLEPLRRFRGQPLELRAHISRCLGEIEREHHAFIPEWCAPVQAFMVDTMAGAVEIHLFGAPCLQVGNGALEKAAQLRAAARERDEKAGVYIP